MPRRRIAMISCIVLAVLGAAVLLWRGEGLTGPMILAALAAAVVLQLDARRRGSSQDAETRRTRAEVRSLARQLDRTTTTWRKAAHEEHETVREQIHDLSSDNARLASKLDALAAEAAHAQRRHEQTSRQVRALGRDTLTQMQAQLQLQQLFAPTAPLPPVAGWAMEPTALVELINIVHRERPRVVVECGSGTSTLWLAYALRRNGEGQLISLDHQAEFAEKSQQMLVDHDLTEWARVRHAPLRQTDTPRGEMPWYTLDSDEFDDVDLLVVDGPPKATGELARYPALPVLADSLAPDARILFDDADRPDEVAVLDAWRESWNVVLDRDVAGRALLLRIDGGSGAHPSSGSGGRSSATGPRS